MRGTSWRGGGRRYETTEGGGNRYRPYQFSPRPGQFSHQYSGHLNYSNGDWTDVAQEERSSATYIPSSTAYPFGSSYTPEGHFGGPVFRGIPVFHGDEDGRNFPYGEPRFSRRRPLLPTPQRPHASFDSSWRRRNGSEWDAHTTSSNQGLSRFNPRLRSPSPPWGPSEVQYEDVSRNPSRKPDMAEQATQEHDTALDEYGRLEVKLLKTDISDDEKINVESIPLPGETEESRFGDKILEEGQPDFRELVSPSLEHKVIIGSMIDIQYKEVSRSPSQEPAIAEQATQEHEMSSHQNDTSSPVKPMNAADNQNLEMVDQKGHEDIFGEDQKTLMNGSALRFLSIETETGNVGEDQKEDRKIIEEQVDQLKMPESPESMNPSGTAGPTLEPHGSAEPPSIESSPDTLPEWSLSSIDPFEDSDGTGWCFGMADDYEEAVGSSSDDTSEWQYSPYPGMNLEMEFTD
ncbi:hypothetical protein B9Z55_011225 [Caenorhabditis nigoni]|nr:hypothetical protein B9Z55_011225 [Caenorhabditis nigoni]